MSTLSLQVRKARAEDAAKVALVYLDSWHDTYPGLLPTALLQAMTPESETAHWSAAIRTQGYETVLVAENDDEGIVGMASLGPARDGSLGYDGEVYTLYVDPACYGRGIGRALLDGAFHVLNDQGMRSCLIWAHARNHARFFYEALGGRLVAERSAHLKGAKVPEYAFGWRNLSLAERSHAR